MTTQKTLIAALQRALLKQHAAEKALKDAIQKTIRAKADAVAAERELHVATGKATQKQLRELDHQLAELTLNYETPWKLVHPQLSGGRRTRLVGL
jgi:hypothetical protein